MSVAKNGTRPVMARLPNDIYKGVRDIADREERSVSYVISRIIKQHINASPNTQHQA